MTAPSAIPAIIGYVTPLSARPGQNLSFRISSRGDAPFRASVLRIHCADPNPAGPGMQLEAVDVPLAASHAGHEQPVHAGSCAWAPLASLADRIVLRWLAKPTLVRDESPQVLASLQHAQGESGVALVSTPQGLVVMVRQGQTDKPGSAQAGDQAAQAGSRAAQAGKTPADPKSAAKPACPPAALQLPTGLTLQQDRWHALALTVELASGRIDVTIEPVAASLPGAAPAIAAQHVTVQAPAPLAAPALLCLGAWWQGHPSDGFNGLIEAPALSAGRPRDAGDSDSARDSGAAAEIARWDLSADMHAETIPGASPGMPALTLVNTPVRAVRGSTWSGRQQDWKQAPHEYAAMHLHADALSDCGWHESLSLAIPAGLKSGVYGLQVDNDHGSDIIPFYVTPAPDGPRARVLFLASTLTYQAYANHARGNYAGELAQRIEAWQAYPHNPDVLRQFGASTYNRYKDMAGISLSSRLRPMLTMRPGYLTFADPKGSGLRHFPADSHLTQWLREQGHDYDVITDEDLDDQGLAALRPYDVIMTGTHPEYHTRRMIEALIAYREAGGYLMYLGANGFYWKIARPAHAPHLLEIRRAEGGIRAWASEPGEYYNQLDGEYGGMWRRNGIAPQATGGVGFAVQGGYEGVGYRRTAESYEPDVAWLFDGVAGETLGDYGCFGGGAAGFELDQVVPELGSPGYLKIVAISEGHGPSFKIVPEEILTWTIAASLPRHYEGVRAHMAVGVSDAGGGLFAVGSITFLGSLAHNRYDNDVSRLLGNCLARFLSLAATRRADGSDR